MSVDAANLPAELAGLGDELRRRFSAAAAAGLDHRIDLDFGPAAAASIRLEVSDGQLALSFAVPESAPTRAGDVRFFFPDVATGRALLLGEANAIDAFMRGDFRSDGYLMLSFALMQMFNSTSLPPAPLDD
ncbi:MAG: hypothetical protein AAF515_03895 [Pseudomonadota bacterium]